MAKFHCIATGKLSAKGSDMVRLSKGILDRLKRIYLLFEINKTYWQGKKDLSKALIEERLVELYLEPDEDELFEYQGAQIIEGDIGVGKKSMVSGDGLP